jgi:SAM-dependent methyltransferase
MSSTSPQQPMPLAATRPRARRVRALYGIAGARWYDPFRAAWTALTSRPAEAVLDRLIVEVARPDSRVLDIGCGTGYNLARLRQLAVPFGTYLGVDLSPAMLAIAREEHAGEPRSRFVEGDLHALATMEQRFDLVVCTWVASHLERPRDVFELAYQLLAPGGHAVFLLMTPPPWYVRWWFAPLVRLFQTRWVDPEVLRDLPGLAWAQHFRGGLVTAVHLVREAS